MDTLPPCPFKQLLHNNRGNVGWKMKNKSIVLDTKRTFEQLHISFFLSQTTCFLYLGVPTTMFIILLFHRCSTRWYAQYSPSKNKGIWTWKVLIVSIFMNEFMGHHDLSSKQGILMRFQFQLIIFGNSIKLCVIIHVCFRSLPKKSFIK